MAKTLTFKSEKDVKRHIKVLLDKHGWFHWMPPANGFGKGGISDHNAIRDGIFMAVEAKFGNGKPTENQKDFLREIKEADGLAFVVHDKNIGWFDIFLQAFDASVAAQRSGQEPKPEDGAAMVNATRELTALYWTHEAPPERT